MMKSLAGDLANSVEGSPLQTLFLHPTAPYWFLYTLFFVFLITPTASSKLSMFGLLAVSITLKLIYTIGGGLPSMPYVADSVCINLIWFVAGMMIAFHRLDRYFSYRSALVGATFLPLSLVVYTLKLGSLAWLLVGFLACVCILSACTTWSRVHSESRCYSQIAQWTMPIFLMHTICAAGIRIGLLKFGIVVPVVHFAFGLAAGFIGPVFAILIMERLRPLDFFVYPTRYIKFERNA